MRFKAIPYFVFSLWLLFALPFPALIAAPPAEGGYRPRNVVLILSDDHRYDFMSFHSGAPAFLQTPNMDRMAEEGAHLANAFVTTSLCSPSRASILTGQYMHRHRVVDNQRPVPEGTVFFPQRLQKAGVRTAFIGKWHMGHDSDDPQPGFDYWAGIRGQGTYFDQLVNINGEHRQFTGYNSDTLAEIACEWLDGRKVSEDPFFLYLSFKAPHYPFTPAPRHEGIYRGKPIPYPETMARTERNYRTQPRWVAERRFSIHGIDHMETGAFDHDPVPDFDEFYWGYCEAVHSLDENIGRVFAALEQNGLDENTMVVYMGDNGFHLGEHGFYDKRDAFETSIRVPLLVWAPGMIRGGTQIDSMVLNLDIAPTILSAFGLSPESEHQYDGHSFLPLLQGENIDWRDHFLYEYQWEWNFPATPTLFAIRTDRFKYVHYQGTWDIDSFHDLRTDPYEQHNLISVPVYQEQIQALRAQLFRELEERGGLTLPVRPPRGERLDQRKISLAIP
jgi:N-acetylglucosamine-6-sulfatase